jgi:hypothetical protein
MYVLTLYRFCHEYYFTTTEIDNGHNTIHLYYGKPYLMEKQPTKYVYMKQNNYQHKYNDWLIDWCLTTTLTVFQLYRGVIYTEHG